MEKNKKVLFIALSHKAGISGGKVITDRNYSLLCEYFGKANIYHIKDFGIHTSIKDIFYESKVERIIERIGIDIVFIDNSIMGYFSKSFYKKHFTICFFHNVEQLYFKQENKLSLKAYIKYLVLKARERNNAKYPDITIALNDRDAKEIKRLYNRYPEYILPSAMMDVYADKKESNNTFPYNNYLLFVGTDFFGNTKGLFPFISEVMPNVDTNLLVVGNGMDKYQSTEKVIFIGYTEDLSDVYANAMAVVLPIVSGSGMKTKTCEALMYGKRIFGTKEAFEGFTYIDKDECVLCMDNKDFIDKINEYLKNPVYFSDINRRTYLDHYSYDAIKSDFFSFLDGKLYENKKDKN